MGFLNTIQNAIAKRLARSAPADAVPDFLALPASGQGAGEAGMLDADISSQYTKQWQLSRHRNERHEIRVRMDTQYALISKALDVTADVATAPEEEGDAAEAFTLQCEDDPTLAEAERLCTTIQLKERSWSMARRLAQFGNEMREVVLDASGSRVVRYKLLPEHQMWKRFDQYGNPKDPPWEQRTYYIPDGSGIGFALWQIVHYSYPGDTDEDYGRGILDCEREWMRLQGIEDDMVLARRQRAYDRIVHMIPVKDGQGRDEQEQTVKRYQERLTRRRTLDAMNGTSSRDNPNSVTQDFYVPYAGAAYPDAGPRMLESKNTQLTNIRDVEYLRGTVLARLGVPMRYLNLGGSEAAKATLGNGSINYEDIQFARTIRGLQKALANGHQQVITLHLILRGLNPIEHPVSLQFPVISTSDAKMHADMELTRAQALTQIAAQIQVPAEMVIDHYMGLTTAEKERWFGDLQESIRAQAADGLTRTRNLQEIAASILTMAHKEMGLEPGDAAISGSHDHGEDYPCPLRAG